jgi:hypothetical protein
VNITTLPAFGSTVCSTADKSGDKKCSRPGGSHREDYLGSPIKAETEINGNDNAH